MEEKPEEYLVRKQHKPTLSRDWAPASRKKDNNLLSLESPPKSSLIKPNISSPSSYSSKANYLNYWKNRVNSPKNSFGQQAVPKPKGGLVNTNQEHAFDDKRNSLGALSEALIDPPIRPMTLESKHLVKSSFDETKLREHISLGNNENLNSLKRKGQNAAISNQVNDVKKPGSLTSSYYYSLYGSSTASKLLNLYENCYARPNDNPIVSNNGVFTQMKNSAPTKQNVSVMQASSQQQQKNLQKPASALVQERPSDYIDDGSNEVGNLLTDESTSLKKSTNGAKPQKTGGFFGNNMNHNTVNASGNRTQSKNPSSDNTKKSNSNSGNSAPSTKGLTAQDRARTAGDGKGITSSLTIEDPKVSSIAGISKFTPSSERSKDRQRSFTPKGKIQTSFKSNFQRTFESSDAASSSTVNTENSRAKPIGGKENFQGSIPTGYLAKKVNLKLENTSDLRNSHEGFVSSTTKNSDMERRLRNELQMSIEALTNGNNNEEKENNRPKSSDVHKANGLNDFLLKKMGDIKKRTNSEEERPSSSINFSGIKKALERENEELSKKVQKKIEEQKQKVKGAKVLLNKNTSPNSHNENRKPGATTENYSANIGNKAGLSGSFKESAKEETSVPLKKNTNSFGQPAAGGQLTRNENSRAKASEANPQSKLEKLITKVNKGEIFSHGVNPMLQKGRDEWPEEDEESKKEEQNFPSEDRRPHSAQGKVNCDKPKSATNAEKREFNFGTGQQGNGKKIESHTNRVKSPKGNIKEEKANPQDSQRQSSLVYYMTKLGIYCRSGSQITQFNRDETASLFLEHLHQSFQSLHFCKNIKIPDLKAIQDKIIYFKKRESHKDKKTLVFDLDETLIHCNESLDVPSDVVLPIKFPNGEIIEAGINIRPHVHECLRELNNHFEIIVFTASHACYANKVLDYLDPKGSLIHHRVFRDNCVVTDEGVYIKDLRIFGDRKIDDIIIVDNASYSFGFQLNNGVPILPFYNNKKDEELRDLIPYLKSLAKKDMKEINKNTFKMHMYSHYPTIDSLLQHLFE